MEQMIVWWESLSDILRVLYCMAVPSTLLLVIQTLMSMLGSDSGEGVNYSDTSGLDLDVPDGADVNLDFDLPDQMDMQHYTDGSSPGDATAMRLLTLQTIVAFLTVFSWSSIASIHAGTEPLFSLLFGLVLGGIAMFLVAKLVQASSKLAENGTISLKNAIGENGRVYLPIAAKGVSPGKVMVQVQGQLRECSAITEGDAIPTGTSVRIVDLRGDMLIVEREET
jgi:membrane protein implicated in regulation of membrane protease activity